MRKERMLLFQKEEFEAARKLQTLERTYSAISALRILSFLMGAGLILIGVFDHKSLSLAIGILGLLFFGCLIVKHNQIVEKMETEKNRRTSIDGYLKRFDGGWRKFSDNGSGYLLPEDTVASDIDLLGPDSLYQMICVCHTPFGKQSFVESLKHPLQKKRDYVKMQAAEQELLGHIPFIIDFEGAGIRLETGKQQFKPERFLEHCKKDTGKLPAWVGIVSWILPILMLVSLFAAGFHMIGFGMPVVLFFVQLILSWLAKPVSDTVIAPFYYANSAVDGYLDMMKLLSKEQFSSEYLRDIQNSVNGENGALAAFSKLRTLAGAYNIMYNPLLHQVLSGLLLWDFQLAKMTEKWVHNYGKKIEASLYALASLEELLCFTTLAIVRDTGWAELTDTKEGCRLSGNNLYHPLVNPDCVVANSAELHSGITIITGSNMSGKTTFLRTLAMNLALAYMGAPICGEKLVANRMELFTSMRVTDDVAHGISTFYAEILRIKAMADFKKQNIPMLCLIDEIFKGTNSADRIVGATKAIRELSGTNSMVIVSTHDFELCNIADAKGNVASNYHFQEYYEQDELRFDYKIRDGRCTTTNAKAILRMAGFDVED